VPAVICVVNVERGQPPAGCEQSPDVDVHPANTALRAVKAAKTRRRSSLMASGPKQLADHE
jgi:hypothetical protein